MKKFAIALARALAAMGMLVTVLVVEAGKLVLKTVRMAFAPPQQQAEAEAAVEAEAAALQQLTAKPPKFASGDSRQHVIEFGQAALAYLAGDDAQRATARDALDADACQYLDSLSVEQGKSLLGRDPVKVAAHILGEQHLPGLPRPESLEERASRLRNEATRQAESYRVLSESIEWMLDPEPDDRGECLGLRAA